MESNHPAVAANNNNNNSNNNNNMGDGADGFYQPFYDAWEAAHRVETVVVHSAIDTLFASSEEGVRSGGFERMARCRRALEAIDSQGWERSYHQKEFHDTFIRACARVFWKTERPGRFARDHQRILQLNSWDHLCQEILVSTPRR